MPLRQPFSGFVKKQWRMKKFGWKQAESTIEQQLAKGRDKQIFTAHDFADLHCGVIHRCRELIGWYIVASPNDEIAEIATRYC